MLILLVLVYGMAATGTEFTWLLTTFTFILVEALLLLKLLLLVLVLAFRLEMGVVMDVVVGMLATITSGYLSSATLLPSSILSTLLLTFTLLASAFLVVLLDV